MSLAKAVEPLAGGLVQPHAALGAPILVVDDNPAKLLAVRSILAPVGYRIVEADSGVAALRCVTAQDFAVILLDVRMPIMDGFETAALIRLRRQSEMTPIIFNTAEANDELVASDRYAEGAVDFISTPVNPHELRAKVAAFARLFVRAEELAAGARDVQLSVDRLRVLTEATPIGIFQTDAENRYVYTNPRWSEITGIPATSADHQPWDIIIDDQQRSDLAADLLADPAEHGEFSRRRFTLAVDGSSRTVQMTSRHLLDGDGEVSGWVGTLSDVTAEVEAETALSEARDQADQASRLKSDFLANMSHEIRTPMNGVLGMTDLLLETELDDQQQDYAKTVRISGEALLAVINDILDFSKIETGKLELEEVDFDLHRVVGDVVHLLAPSARAKGLALASDLSGSVPAVVWGDPGRLRQVLTNLVGNAVKFTTNGEIVVRVMVTAGTAADEPVLRFEVVDSGVGIDPDKVAVIFEPFVQADSSTSRRYGGTGLGLAISSQLVGLMGGELGVTSRPGAGSTFWFALRLKTSAVDQQPVDPSHVTQIPPDAASRDRVPDVVVPPSAPAGPAHGRVLLAEDNVINRKVAVAMLSGAGYQVDTAINGAEAVQATLEHRYDAILMDCQMPELNGYEATAAIRAREAADRHTPIIALTASARREDQQHCLAAGMDLYLAKPFGKDALLAMVRQSMAVPVA